jgi:hypothetical protein
MRPVAIAVLLLILLVILAGCGQRVPTRNTTTKNPWANVTATPKEGSASQTTPVPTTPSPIVQVTLIPTETVTSSIPATPVTTLPPVKLAGNLTLIDTKTLSFIYNATAFEYTLENPPLVIDYTLTVPNITKKRVIADPVSGADKTVIITYPDPLARFEVTVMDTKTERIIARNGYGGQYDVSYTKRTWVRYPGTYYIEFSGNKVTAKIEFLIPEVL